MTEYRIVKRVESGLTAEVYNNDGVTLRPAMPLPIRRVAIHYTGSPKVYGTPDLATAQEYLRRIQANAQQTGKSNEYNYCVTSTLDYTVLEYAGLFQAAHSPGENLDTLAILCFAGGVVYSNGVYQTSTEVPSDALVDKVRWLVFALKVYGVLAQDCEITLHRLLPGASTVCPGPAVESKVPAMRVPWVPPPPPPSTAAPLGRLGVQATSATRSWYDLARCALDVEAAVWSPEVKVLGESIQTLNEGHQLHTGDWYYLPKKG